MLQGIIQLMTGVNCIEESHEVIRTSSCLAYPPLLPQLQNVHRANLLNPILTQEMFLFQHLFWGEKSAWIILILVLISVVQSLQEWINLTKPCVLPNCLLQPSNNFSDGYILEICKILQLCLLPAYCTLFPFHTISCMQFSPEYVLT